MGIVLYSELHFTFHSLPMRLVLYSGFIEPFGTLVLLVYNSPKSLYSYSIIALVTLWSSYRTSRILKESSRIP